MEQVEEEDGGYATSSRPPNPPHTLQNVLAPSEMDQDQRLEYRYMELLTGLRLVQTL